MTRKNFHNNLSPEEIESGNAKAERFFEKLNQDISKGARPYLEAIDRWLANDGKRLDEFSV